jgi:hypothetical protein
MAELVPAIHVGVRIAGSSLSPSGDEKRVEVLETAAPRLDVDARNKSGHDDDGVEQ